MFTVEEEPAPGKGQKDEKKNNAAWEERSTDITSNIHYKIHSDCKVYTFLSWSSLIYIYKDAEYNIMHLGPNVKPYSHHLTSLESYVFYAHFSAERQLWSLRDFFWETSDFENVIKNYLAYHNCH